MTDFIELGRQRLPTGGSGGEWNVLPTPGAKDIEMATVIVPASMKGVEDSFVRPEPDTMAVIMYTSGSTGKPKGVMLKHKNVLASIAAMQVRLQDLGLGSDESYVAYLPAAHILELVAK